MASGDSLLILTPNMAVPPATTYAQLDVHAGASTPAEAIPCIDFDAAASEYMDFPNLFMPENYSDATGITLIIVFAAPGEVTATDEVRWEVALRLIGDDIDPLSTSHTYVYTGVSADPPSVANEVAYETLALTKGAQMDTVIAGSYFNLRIYRDHDHADDTAAGDAELFAIHIKET